MSKLTKVTFKLLDLMIVFVMIFGAPMSALAQETTPALATDKSDYAPGETVHFTGTGFPAGEYTLSVNSPDGMLDWGAVSADEGGGFASDSPALASAGAYELFAFAAGAITPVASVGFTVTASPDPTDEPTEPPTAEPTPELIPFIQSDKADYAPGELVTLTGGNWQGDEFVRIFVNDDLGQTWSRDTIVKVAEDGTIVDQFNLPDWFVATYVVLAGGQQTGRAITTSFTDSAGSYSLKWTAADPAVNRAPYLPTYTKVRPPQTCPTGGRASDPMPNAVAYGPTFKASDFDAVTSLMPKDLALGQIVPFEIEIKVSGSTAPENGTIQFVGDWLAKTTSGGDFGFDPTYGVICAFVDYGDVGTVDPGLNAQVDSFSSVRLGEGTNNDRTQGTIQVSGLNDGDNIIVEVWVVLKSIWPTSGATGNVQTSLQSAQTGTGNRISVGNQTVPLLQVGDFVSADADVSIAKSDSPDPVVAGQQLTYSIVVTNNSASTVANGIVVTDTLDPNVSFVSGTWPGGTCTASAGIVICNVGSLSPLQSATITVVTTVSLTAPINNDPSTNPETGTCSAAGPGIDLCNKVSFTMITSDPSTGNNSDSEPTNVVANPAIDIEKTPDTQSVTYGGTAVFTITVTNTGDVPLTNVAVTDPNAPNCAATIGNLAVGAVHTYSCSVSNVTNGFTNTATVTGNFNNTTVTDNDDAVVTLSAAPSIDIEKTPDTQTVLYGATANFTIVVTNTGNVPLSNVTVTDPLAPDCANTIGDLAIGGSTTYTCSLANVTSGFTNVAYASGTYGTTEVTDNDNAVVVVDILPDISVTKTANPTSVPENGGDVEFTFVVTNNSTEPFILNSLTDDKFGNLDGQGTCDVTPAVTIAAGGTYTCKVTKFLASDALTPHTNVVTASGTDEQGNPDSATDDETVTFTDVAPVIRITKTADPTHVKETGENVTFTFLVENIGVEDVTLTTLSDTVFGDLDGKGTCDVPQTILIGGSYSCAYTVFLASDSLTAHTNVVTATAVDDDGTTATDDDDETVTFDDVKPDIEVTKTASPTHVPETGGDVTFTFFIENVGVEDVTITTLNDSVFGNLLGQGTCAATITILAGEDYTCSITKWLASDSLTAHTNVVTATGTDDDGSTDTDTDDETVTFDDVAPAIKITKSADPTHVPETGGNVTFTFLVENIGMEDVTLTSLTDTVFGDLDGKGTCDVPQTILIGGSYSCEYTVSLASDSLTAHTNVVTATAVDDDNTPATDDDDETVTFDDVAPAIQITKSADPTHVKETGGDVTFTFLVENIGVEDVTLTSLTDTVFGDLNGQGDCVTGGLIPVDGSYSCSITVFLSSDNLTAHYNVATAVGTDDDGTAATDDDDETVTFDDVAPLIRITKTADPTHVKETGENVTFTFLVENIGVEDVTLTSLTDTVFGDLDGKGTCDVPQIILIGGSYTCTYTVFLSSDSLTAHYNVVTATAVDDDGTTATDDDDETVTFDDVKPTVDLTKSVDSNGTFNVGDTATYTLEIHNTSPEAVTISDLTDTNALSAGCQALIGTSIPAGGTVSCTYTVIHKTAGTYPNTASVTVADNEGNEASASDDESITVYAPVVSKTANGTYDEVHDWEVFKSVNTASQNAFAGEKKNFTWTVRVDETTHGENYLVTGDIVIVNPNPDDPMTLALDDVLNDGSVATINDCTGTDVTWNSITKQVTIPAGGTATCDYSVIPQGDMNAFNTALPAQVTMSVQYPYAGGPAYFPVTTISGGGALNGTYEGWCADIDHTIAQNTNYTANVYSSYESLPAGIIEKAYNLDLVNWIINQDYVGKPAGGSLGNYTYGDVQRAIWELLEDNGTANTSGLNNWNQTRVNQIKAAAVADGEGFVPTCGDFVAVILQPVGGAQLVTIAQVTFASLGIDCAESNAVTAVLNDIEFPASAEILWTVNQVNPTATLDDDQKTDWPTTVSADATFTYQDPQGYTCSTNPAAYTNGYYQYTESNTAVLVGLNKQATASTAVKCYAPVVTKTAAGAYDERHEWDVEKSVDPTTQNAFAGDTVSYEWTVTVAESVFEENFVASGTISVKNPRPDGGNMTVKLTDALSDGFVPTITGCTGGTWNATNKTVAVPPNTTAVCDYTASLTYSDDATAPTNNTVTAELMVGATHLTTTASDAVEWTANVIRSSATLDDDQNPAFPLDITDGDTWEYTENYTCSTTEGAYTDEGKKYTFGDNNTATVTSGDKSDSASASTAVTCYWPQIELTKTGNELSKIGDGVNYTITLDNKTPISAGLRDLACTISDPTIGFSKTVTLASGASDTSTKAFTIPTTASDPFLNTASVTCSPLGSTFSVGDSSQWSTNLFQPKVEIIKTGPAYATSGDTITYNFTINNLGSADSPNLMLDTLTDNVLGDLADDAPAACDELAAGASCSFTVDYTVPDVGLQPQNKKNIVTVHYHPAGFPNDITDTDDHTVTVTPKSQLTDTSFCPLANNQFRLLYRLEVAPNIYRLGASNPGQFYFNGFYFGEPGEQFTMTLQVPYPFVTQEGAGNPIQVHDGTTLTSAGCYSPTPSLSGFTILTQAMTQTSSAGNQIITPEDYATKQLGEYTTVTVSGVVPDTGFAYVTIHLDYSLKKTSDWKNPGTATLNPVTNTSILDMQNLTGFGSGTVTIHGYEVYNFARTVGGDTATTTPSSYNEIKKFAGFLGIVTDKDGEPLLGVTVKIYSPTNTLLATLTTDEDGYYFFEYKHKAKSATYKVVASYGSWSQTVSITIKANGFAAIDFEVP